MQRAPRSRRLLVVQAIVLSLLLVAPQLAPLEVGAGLARAAPGPGLRFIDVGQGSALLVVGSEGHALLVDAGPPGGSEAILAALVDHDVRTIDLWVLSHFDTDHVGGFARALAGSDGLAGTGDDLQVVQRWDRGLDALPDTPAAQAYVAAAIPRRAVVAGERWRAPGIEVRVVPAGTPPERAAENARGLALCIDVAPIRLLAPGDLPAEQVAAAAAACGPVDVLWASHHGSRTGISQAVLAAADPALVIVSAGPDNSYCHPHLESLVLLHDTPVWLTDLAGASPSDTCPGLATAWGPEHHVALGDLWLSCGEET